MNLFKKIFGKKNLSEKRSDFDINTSVENPELVKCMHTFLDNKTEANLSKFITQLLKANFLVLTYNDEMNIQENQEGTFITQNSILKFLNCFDPDGNTFLPLFTDWGEVHQWLEKEDKNIGGFVMNTFEAFEFANSGEDYNGIIINPGSKKPWLMNKEQIANFLQDFKA